MTRKIKCQKEILLVSMLALLITSSFFSRFSIVKAEVTPSEGEKWAIIIGVSDYQYFDDPTYADNDAMDLYSKIAPVYGTNHVMLLINSNATKSEIKNAIYNWLAPLESVNDTVLFFFGGHGINGTDTAPFDEADNLDEYLCPYDSLSTSYENDIRDNELNDWLNVLDSGKVAIILGNCHSGGFVEDLAKSGRVILAACAENESAWYYGTLGNSIFSYYFIQAMSTPAADLNSNNFLSAEELFSYANTSTINLIESNSYYEAQHPAFYDGYTGEISLAPLSLTNYLVTFIQTGLPTNMNWSVTLNGTTLTSNGNSITFSITSGNYNYGIDLPSGYTSLSPSTGSIIVNTNETVSFTVTISSNDSTGTANSTVMIMALAIIGAIIAIIVVCAILIVRNQRTQTIPPPPPPIYGQPAIQKINCMFYNQENNAYATYCIACGRQLRDPLTRQPVIVMPLQQICTFCGQQNSANQNFCTFCGKKLK